MQPLGKLWGLNVVITFLHGNSLEYVPKNWCRDDKKFGWKHVFTINEEVGMYTMSWVHMYIVQCNDVISFMEISSTHFYSLCSKINY